MLHQTLSRFGAELCCGFVVATCSRCEDRSSSFGKVRFFLNIWILGVDGIAFVQSLFYFLTFKNDVMSLAYSYHFITWGQSYTQIEDRVHLRVPWHHIRTSFCIWITHLIMFNIKNLTFYSQCVIRWLLSGNIWLRSNIFVIQWDYWWLPFVMKMINQ